MVSRKLALLIALITLAACAAVANVPPVISYQGKVTSDGVPKADGTYPMTFAIYDAATGGNLKWSETNPSVQVKGGVFSVMLGSITPFPADLFDGGTLYFGVAFGDEAEMTPRQQIASVAFAQVSKTVVDGSITVGKLAANAVTSDKIAPGAITADKIATNVSAVPDGVIVMWSGSIANIPPGWVLCNGQNGSPDLRDKFVVAAGAAYPVAATGGVATNNMAHSHTANLHAHDASHGHTASTAPDHRHGVDFYTQQSTMYYPSRSPTGANQDVLDFRHTHRVLGDTGWGGNHTHTISNAGFSTGNQTDRGMDPQLSTAVENRPPYYALAYIMKLHQ